MTIEEFAYAFANRQNESVVQVANATQVIPESHHLGKDALTQIGAIDEKKPRGPLLMIAGEVDHIIPAALNYKNFEVYRSTPGRTDFRMFLNRNRWPIVGASWEETAGQTLTWMQAQRAH